MEISRIAGLDGKAFARKELLDLGTYLGFEDWIRCGPVLYDAE